MTSRFSEVFVLLTVMLSVIVHYFLDVGFVLQRRPYRMNYLTLSSRKSPRHLMRRQASTASASKVVVPPAARIRPGPPRPSPLYVAATRQHVGKTSVSLALMSGLQKRYSKVGFIKPVGQQSLQVVLPDQSSRMIDKDAVLIKEHFQLDQVQYEDISPLLIPSGYTRAYVDGHKSNTDQQRLVLDAYRRVAQASDVVLCEGTGHVAVGSIVEASNAHVAQWMGAKIVLIANGGLGKAFDELCLNKQFADEYGVEIVGVIVNKVQSDKYDQTKQYLQKVLRDRWGMDLIGCVPDRSFLGSPALADLERLFDGSSLISGQKHRMRHYRVQDLNLVATSLEVFLRNLRQDPHRMLYVCHASRNDILLGFLMEMQQRSGDWESAIVVTGCRDYPISTQVLEIITSMPNAPPVLLANESLSSVMESIHHFTPKLRSEDEHRVETTVNHYEPYIDFELLLEKLADKQVADVQQ